MPRIPAPPDPVLRLEIGRDLVLAGLWTTFCSNVLRGRKPSQQVAGRFLAYAHAALEPLREAGARQTLAAWRSKTTGDFGVRRAEREETAKLIFGQWGKALRLLDQVISLAEEFGMIHSQRLEAACGALPLSHRLILALESRGVLVAEEIFALLRAGFAAGAEARWRTLHETAVVALFILRHGDDTARRYVDHDTVQVCKAMREEQEHHEVLGLEPYTDEEVAEAEREYAALGEHYGKGFLTDWGWAAEALGRKREGKPPTFRDLEASLNLSPMRAPYRSASQAVHAGPRSLLDNPGQPPQFPQMMLTRPTPYGLRDSGVRTASSILMLGRALMSCNPFPSDLLGLRALELLVPEVVRAFDEAFVAAMPAHEVHANQFSAPS